MVDTRKSNPSHIIRFFLRPIFQDGVARSGLKGHMHYLRPQIRAAFKYKMRHFFNRQDQKQLLVLCSLIPCHKIISFHARKVRFLPR